MFSGTTFVVILTLYAQCYCDKADNFDNFDDVEFKFDPFYKNARPFGIQPVKVDVKVAETLTDSKYDHFKKLTGKQHSHLSGKKTGTK